MQRKSQWGTSIVPRSFLQKNWQQKSNSLPNSITVDFGEVKTTHIECKENCFQTSLQPIFTIVKHLNVDDSSKKEVR